MFFKEYLIFWLVKSENLILLVNQTKTLRYRIIKMGIVFLWQERNIDSHIIQYKVHNDSLFTSKNSLLAGSYSGNRCLHINIKPLSSILYYEYPSPVNS